MEPLKLLLVSFPSAWSLSLSHSLQAAGYTFEFQHVPTKKQALLACCQSKYDILITSHRLPDGPSKDLVQALGSTVACLVISESTPFVAPSHSALSYTEKSYQSLSQPTAWIYTLKQVLAKWEQSVSDKISQTCHDRRLLFDKVAARFASELYQATENRIENALKVILDILEVSRIYVRGISIHKKHPSLVVHEVSAPGQPQFPGPFNSSYEVSIRQANGEVSYLGVVDTLNQRVWDQAETDLLKTVASLLRKNPEEIRRSIAMYRELGMTA